MKGWLTATVLATCCATATAWLEATETGQDSGGGNGIGWLNSAYLDYKLNDHWSFAAMASHFSPGDAFADGHDTDWIRLESKFAF
ncbi:MAG: hypothetical protein WC789_00620 [Lentisphaeria bacterium]|jgi:hypothetical protein